ncbi:MAG TPA: translation initiation factor IF-2 [Trueperaceae bacterium]|nr:translation initiation factor IF-2 [Trueperaceae bacterium]
MSDKVRIYQLAKDLGIETKAMLKILDDMGVEYKSHSSTLETDIADAVRELVDSEGSGGSGGAEPATAAAAKAAEPAAAEPAGAARAEVAPAGAARAGGAATATRPRPSGATTAAAAEAPLRAPVVTVMGHVDHGKTTLLDYVRHTKVAEGEAGGITQHIGAYQAETKGGVVTFLDTPGHEAFTSIRQRGTNATDIAVIVVAADDSIMPQTREAIAHAKAAKVPIIVAINKCDLPQADPEKVKRDLMQVELVPEDFGGDTIVVPISAKTGQGVDDLLEMISLVAEVEELRASTDGPARAIVIESVLDKRAGVLATVLVQEGTLHVADYIVSGETWAKVRRLTDYTGASIQEAGPSVPVQVLGFSSQPTAGDPVEAVADEQTAKRIAGERRDARKELQRETIGRKGLTLADLFGKPKKKVINLILRADAQGSLEAIKGVLAREAETTEEVELEIMLAEVGAPTESDLLLASTAEATVITFGVTPPGSVKKAAERQNVPIKSYRIIYELIEDVQRMIRGQIEPAYEERVIGHAEVRAVIHVPRSGNIAGSYVTDGVIRRGSKARVTRGGKEVYKGSVAQLRRFKDDVREVASGFECGIHLQNYDNVQEGDVVEVYEMVEVAPA